MLHNEVETYQKFVRKRGHKELVLCLAFLVSDRQWNHDSARPLLEGMAWIDFSRVSDVMVDEPMRRLAGSEPNCH